jgi:hypothetical protein
MPFFETQECGREIDKCHLTLRQLYVTFQTADSGEADSSHLLLKEFPAFIAMMAHYRVDNSR